MTITLTPDVEKVVLQKRTNRAPRPKPLCSTPYAKSWDWDRPRRRDFLSLATSGKGGC